MSTSTVTGAVVACLRLRNSRARHALEQKLAGRPVPCRRTVLVQPGAPEVPDGPFCYVTELVGCCSRGGRHSGLAVAPGGVLVVESVMPEEPGRTPTRRLPRARRAA